MMTMKTTMALMMMVMTMKMTMMVMALMKRFGISITMVWHNYRLGGFASWTDLLIICFPSAATLKPSGVHFDHHDDDVVK